MNRRVKLIVCYYGKLPEWFNLWLLSCEYNPEFDFLFVTDQDVDKMPNNVTALKIPVGELKNRFSGVLGFECVLDNPYKLCDYKPLYGLALADKLEGYEFWGHCDVDLIFGNLSDHITEAMLNNYDVIGRYGHLILYRNSERINRLYRLNGGAFPYETVYKNPENYSFDEMSGMDRIVKKNNIASTDIKIANAVPELTRIKASGYDSCKEFFCWDKGRLKRVYEKNGAVCFDEYAYLHFSGKKPKCNLSYREAERGFCILSDEIIAFRDSEYSLETISEFNRFVSIDEDNAELKTAKEVKTKKFMGLSMKGKMINIKIHQALLADRLKIFGGGV